MSDYIRQHAVKIDYKLGESWIILNEIEQSIKKKIESVGTPLKDWNISINYGIKTGLNEAFIISKEKRDELIKTDPKSAEIIRPILRGRDIKRNEIDFQDKYLIALFPSRNYDIELFPAIKDWLINGDWVTTKTKKNPPTPIGSGKLRLEQSGKEHVFKGVRFKSRKKTTNKWFETQDSIKYWDDFNHQKLVFSRISGDTPAFAIDKEKMFTNDTGYIITGNNLEYLLQQLINPIIWFSFKKFYMGGGIEKEFKVNNLLNLPVPFMDKEIILNSVEKSYIRDVM